MSTITVIVQAPYPLYADNGQELPQDGNSYVVENTDRIQQYIQLGQLSVIPDAPAPAPAAQDEAPTEEQQTTKKARTVVQKENSDG